MDAEQILMDILYTYLNLDKESGSTQIHYGEVPRWEIFMEQ